MAKKSKVDVGRGFKRISSVIATVWGIFLLIAILVKWTDDLLLSFLFVFLTVGPFIVALFTNHKRKIIILILGILTGWTMIGCTALTIYALQGSRFLPTKKQLNKMKKKTGESDETKLWWSNLPKWSRIIITICLLAMGFGFIVFEIYPVVDRWWDRFFQDNFFTILGIFILLPFFAAFLYIFDFIFDIKKK